MANSKLINKTRFDEQLTEMKREEGNCDGTRTNNERLNFRQNVLHAYENEKTQIVALFLAISNDYRWIIWKFKGQRNCKHPKRV